MSADHIPSPRSAWRSAESTTRPSGPAATCAAEFLGGIGLPPDTFDALAAEMAVELEQTGGGPSPAQREEYARMRRALVRTHHAITFRQAITPGPLPVLAGGAIAWLLLRLGPPAPDVTTTTLLLAVSWGVVALGRLALLHLQSIPHREPRSALLAVEALASLAALLAMASLVRWVLALDSPVPPALAVVLYGVARGALMQLLSAPPRPTSVLTR